MNENRRSHPWFRVSLVIIGAILAVGIGYKLNSRQTSDNSSSEGKDGERVVQKMQNEIDALKFRVAALSKSRISPMEAVETEEDSEVLRGDLQNSATDETRTLSPRDVPALKNHMMTDERLKERSETEEVDAVWANETELQVEAFFRRDDVKSSRIVELECRSTVCKMVVEHESRDDGEQSAELFTMEGPEFQSVSVTPDADEESGYKTTFYMVRKGYNMRKEWPSDIPRYKSHRWINRASTDVETPR